MIINHVFILKQLCFCLRGNDIVCIPTFKFIVFLVFIVQYLKLNKHLKCKILKCNNIKRTTIDLLN